MCKEDTNTAATSGEKNNQPPSVPCFAPLCLLQFVASRKFHLLIDIYNLPRRQRAQDVC